MSLLGGPRTAGLIHRSSALVFGSVFFWHLFYVGIPILRNWKNFKIFGPNSMIPGPQDFKDIFAMFRWFFGKGPRPVFDRWTYWEKFDYWAPFWGVTIIGVSGLVMWFPYFATFLPGWVYNVAPIFHGEEAFLAVVFLFTVHFFNNHFRPDKFPLDRVMFTGTMTLEELKHEHALEYERLLASGELEQHMVDPPSAADGEGLDGARVHADHDRIDAADAGRYRVLHRALAARGSRTGQRARLRAGRNRGECMIRRRPVEGFDATPEPCADAARRRIVLGATAGGAALMFGSGVRAAPGALVTRKIPASNETLPAVGLGTWSAFDVETKGAEFEQAREALARFAQLGGRVVDTSPMYGRAEAALGAAGAAADPDAKLFFATKVWTRGKAEGQAQWAESLRRMGRKRIDLGQVHNLVDVDVQLANLRAARERGEVRYVGVTHYTASAHEELARTLERESVDFLQVNYSIAEPEAAQRLLGVARERGVAVLVNRPFQEGEMMRRVKGRALPPVAAELGCTSAAQVFLKWILAEPAITCVLCGTRKAEHVSDNLGAAQGRLPDAAQRRAIEAWYRT
jgi:aryl-alcohol dehydrogenase-like predicted oxidoreductase/cytochrome b subunit of formate dehydrogenase